MAIDDAATSSLDELHDDYVEQVNLAVAEDRDDIVDALSARFATARVPRPPIGPQAAGAGRTPPQRMASAANESTAHFRCS